ncbi:MAG: NAD(P)/FAD-dependent oxidoreductase [Pyrinomonadaceae bacterium]
MADEQPRILIVGGGFGGLFTALQLGGTNAEITLISREDHFLFAPMLYEYLSGEVEAWQIAPRYKELLNDGVRFIRGEITYIDMEKREAAIAGRVRRAAYDVLVLACGGVASFAGVEGAAEHALAFRTISDADALRNRMIKALDRIAPDTPPQDAARMATFVVVGAGASGVETATKMADLLRVAFQQRGLRGQPRVLILEMTDHVVPGMDDDLRRHVEDALRSKQVEVHTQTRVRRVMANGLTFEQSGRQTELESAAVVWTGGVRVNPLIEKLNLEKDKRGLLVIEETLQARGHENIFALGDIAHYTNADASIAGTAQLANQEASLAANNIKAYLAGKPLQTKHFAELGSAVSLGTQDAAFQVGGQIVVGTLGRDARFTAYTARLPTWNHRLKVGASWFFEGTKPRPLGLR